MNILSSSMPIPVDKLLIGILIMAGVTYLCRVLTLVLVRKKIKNRFFRSILTYLPFGVLSAMVFPEIIYSTSSGGVIVSSAVLIATVCGTIVAIILSLFKRGLFTVTMSTTLAVLVLILILRAMGLN